MNRKKLAKLHRIYRKYPDVGCKGLCIEACSVIALSVGEFRHITKTHGAPKLTKGQCNFLSEGRCSIYDDRPAVCRTLGNEMLPCPYGCKGGLAEGQETALLDEISKLFNEKPGHLITNE